MSQENVELLHRAYDALNERNLDAFLAPMDADVELIPFERALEGGGSYRGHSGFRSWWNDAFASSSGLSRRSPRRSETSGTGR